MRKRSVDVERLLRDALLLLRAKMLECAHVVEAVSELDDDDADVGDHGEQHLANVFSLMVLAVRELDFVELRDAVDDVRDLLPEPAGYFLGGDVRVFDSVMQQTGGDGSCVHLEVGEDLRDLKRMDDVRLAGCAALTLVLLLAEDPCCTDKIEIVVRPVCADSGEYALESSVEGIIECLNGWSCRGGECSFGVCGWAVRLRGGRSKGARWFIQRGPLFRRWPGGNAR